MSDREHPMPGQVLIKVEQFAPSDDADFGEPREAVAELDEANAITSRFAGFPGRTGLHRPVIDVDLRVTVIPSSTPGHCHLYINHVMDWERYQKLLVALADAGIVEPGYVKASIKQGYTTVRLPWVSKYAEPLPAPGEVSA